MGTKLSDLNDHLFAQLDRLTKPELSGEQLDAEVRRCSSLVSVSEQIVKTAALSIAAAKIAADNGGNPDPYLRTIEGERIRHIAADRDRANGG